MTSSALNSYLVFRTNLRLKKDIVELAPYLDKDRRVLNWNIDQDDIDNVLRVASRELEAREVIRLVEQAGFECQELPD